MFIFDFSINVDLAKRCSFIRLGVRAVWSNYPYFLFPYKNENLTHDKKGVTFWSQYLDQIKTDFKVDSTIRRTVIFEPP